MAHRIVGLDVGAESIRAAQLLISARGEVVVEKVGEVPLPESVIETGDVNDQDGLAAVLAKFWVDLGFKTKRVVLGANSMHVFARELSVPVMSLQRIRESLQFLMEGVLPVSPDQLYLDFYPIERKTEESGPVYQGLAVAADKNSVDMLVDAVTKAKLRPIGVDFIPFALLRVRNLAEFQAETLALVDIGAGTTNVVIARGGVPLFVRIIPVGGNDLDRELMFQLKLDHDEAIVAKMGLSADAKDKRSIDVKSVVDNQNMELVANLKNTFEYFGQARPADRANISKVLLSGGGALTLGIADAISSGLGVQVELVNKLANINKAETLHITDERLSHMAMAIGLALGEVEHV